MFVEKIERPQGEPSIDRERLPEAPMKLSRAILLGAMIRPQCTNADLYSAGTSCALGAAYEAIFGKPPSRSGDEDYKRLEKAFPCLANRDSTGMKLMHQITGLNDSQGWSRERIAAWLESQGY